MKNNKITSRADNFAKWYTDVVKSAQLAEYSSVKGCVILEPNGYAIWENMQKNMDKLFKDCGHSNVYLPVFIPESLLQKEGELVSGFAPEVAWITRGGSSVLEERLAFRPTSESLFCDYYKNKVKSYRDLPKLYNQWCSVVRWEKETRPFLRSREFLWQEGHTAHATAKEAQEETQRMLDVYKEFHERFLAIPVITGRKTEKEKFAGAEYTLTIETLMQNGICLQSGTSHYFGQKFAKAYDVKFLNEKNELDYVYQTSWGTTTRMIGAVIMVHGDDAGLVLPPRIAPKQVVIIGIGNVSEKVNEVYNTLKENNISVYIDDSDKTPGFKFAEAEVNGIPVRIEIGERDLAKNIITLVRRDTREKIEINVNENIAEVVEKLLETIHDDMFNRAKERMENRIYEARTLEEVNNIIENTPGFIKADWCGKEECELKYKEIHGIKSRCILENEKPLEGVCPVCGEKADKLVMWGIQY